MLCGERERERMFTEERGREGGEGENVILRER